MNATRLQEIAGKLAETYITMRELEIELSHKREDLAGRKLYLAPESGWEGKNEEQRRTAAERVFATDEICVQIAAEIREAESELAAEQGVAAAYEAERRGLEWGIRGQLVEALRGAHVNGNGHGPVEETAFDDAAQAAVDETVFDELPF